VSDIAVTGDSPASHDADRPGTTGPVVYPQPQHAQGRHLRPRRRELPEGLPAWRRLRSTRDFSRVERQGARASGTFVAVTVRKGPGRLGCVVSKKVDNRASERNQVKRRLREIVRREKDRFVRRDGGSIDVVIMARESAKGLDYAVLRADVLTTLEAACARLAALPPAPRPRR